MKTKLLLLTLVLSGFALYSCSDDDDNPNPGNVAVENAFNAKYPNAGGISWEKKGTYHVADFWLEGLEREAWFDETGEWYLTETDIRFEQLPEAIQTAFKNSEYKDWKVDDVDKLERKDMATVYVIEVEKGNQEYDLYYAEDGTLIKAVLDEDNNNGNEHYLPTSLPENATNFITNNHPNAKIVEVEKEGNGKYFEVDIVEGTAHRELLFTTAGEWVYTKTEDIKEADVPQSVLTALANSEYASYRKDDIDHYNTPAGEYYLFELESGATEVEVKVTLDGVVTKVK